MAYSEQEIRIRLKNQILGNINPNAIRVSLNKAAKEIIKIIVERTAAGYDILGRRFGSYTYNYTLVKRKFLRGGGGRSLAKLRAKKTSEGATKVKDYLRLTGQLFQDITYKIKDIVINDKFIGGSIIIYVKSRSAKKAEGLQRTTGRNRYTTYSKKAFRFLGLSVSGGRVNKERDRVFKVLINTLQTPLTGNIQVR